MHLKNDLNQSIHINFKNCLEKITEMKEKHCYLINENFHDLAALKFIKLFSKYEHSEHSHSVTNSRENVLISFSIKIHQNIKFDQLKKIMCERMSRLCESFKEREIILLRAKL